MMATMRILRVIMVDDNYLIGGVYVQLDRSFGYCDPRSSLPHIVAARRAAGRRWLSALLRRNDRPAHGGAYSTYGLLYAHAARCGGAVGLRAERGGCVRAARRHSAGSLRAPTVRRRQLPRAAGRYR